MKHLDRKAAAKLFDLISVKVTNTRISPRQHRGNVLFVGYADFQIEVADIPFLQMCGNSIKILGDNIHFDPKGERGKNDRKDHFFPHWFPVNGESRAVLTEHLRRNDTIIQMCHKAVNLVTGQTKAATTGNPFGQ